MKRVKFRKVAMATISCALVAGFSVSGGSLAEASSQTPLVIGANNGGLVALNFNPFIGGDNGTSGLLYEPLFYFNLAGPQVYPLLGSSYRWSKGNTVLTIDLRHGVKWSDGLPFTSGDVVSTYEMMKKFPALNLYGIWSYLTSVKAQGRYTVVFTFNAPDVP